MAKYKIRFIHKISSRDSDVMEAELPDNCFSDSKALGRALRNAKVLLKGGRLRFFRVEGDKVVAFPQASIWHSFIITPHDGVTVVNDPNTPRGINHPV